MRSGQNSSAFPGWVKNLAWLVASVVTCTVSVMIYVGDIKMDVAVMQSEIKSLKELLQQDIKGIKDDIIEMRNELPK